MRRHIGLSLALSWGLCGAWLLLSGGAAIPGWLLLAAACAPSLAAFLLARPRPLLRRLVRRAPLWVAVVALVAIPAIALVAGPQGVPPAALFLPLALVAPLGEEFGWRGFALPLLLRRFNPAAATLILAAIWIGWHLPAFLVPGAMRQGPGDIASWALGTIALSFLMSWLFLRGRGNLLVAGIIPHAVIDLLGMLGRWSYSPAQTALLTALATILVAGDRRLFFHKAAAAA